MTRLRILALVFSLLVLAPSGSAQQQAGHLSGTVRDTAKRPLSGVPVKLVNSADQAHTYSTISDASGKFRFDALPLGAYAVTAELSGYTVADSKPVRIDSASLSVVTDVVVSPSADASAAGQAVTSPAASPGPPSFQTSGIRGLIDPGGYSASTDGLAANLVRGMAAVQQPGKEPTGDEPIEQPCSLEPELRRAVATRPDDAAAARRLGEFYLVHGDTGQAIPLLRQALKLQSGDHDTAHEPAGTVLMKGQVVDERSLLAGRMQEHRKAAEIELLARAEQGSARYTEAAQEYRIAQELDPEEENVFGLGYNLLLEGSAAESAEVFREGAASYPRSVTLQIGAGVADSLLGQISEGLRHFLAAADIDPADPRPYRFIAEEFGDAGNQHARVEEIAARHLQRDPANAEANYLYALLLSRKAESDTAQVEALLRRAIQLDSKLSEAHLLLADTLVRRGSYASAIPEYKVAIHLQPALREAHYRLSLAYRHTGENLLASREMRSFLTLKQQSSAEQTAIDLAKLSSSIALQQGRQASSPCPPGRP